MDVNWDTVIETSDLIVACEGWWKGSPQLLGSFMVRSDSRPATVRDIALIAYQQLHPGRMSGIRFIEPKDVMGIDKFDPHCKRITFRFNRPA